MSVNTHADELRQEIETHIKEAVKAANEFLDEDTWGHSDYNDDFIHRTEDLVTDLRVAVRKWKDT